MKLLLRQITYSDKSRAKYLVVNNDNGSTGRTKITVKQWKFFEKMGIKSDEVEIETTEQRLNYILS